MQQYRPFGLRPAFNSSGIMRPTVLATIASGYNTTIYQGAPVLVDGNGQLTAVAAGDDNLWNGIFQGVEFTDVEGRRRYSNRWIAGTVATDIRAYYFSDDPNTFYEVQADGSLNRSAIGDQAPFTTISGSTVHGNATFGLDADSLVGTGDQSQMRIVGLVPGPDNEWGDAFPILLVQNSAHPWVARVNVP